MNPAAGEGTGGTGVGGPDAVRAFTSAIAGDLSLLADLHDREPTEAIVEAVRSGPVQDQFGLLLKDDAGQAALEAMWLAADALPRPLTPAALDALAAGYADVYLRHTYRAAPTESVWMTEDQLERQEPMLQVRALYRRHGLKVADAQNRPDDHLVLQLRFIAHLLEHGTAPDDLDAAAAFMDNHILLWIRRMAVQLVKADAPPWFAALTVLTASYLDELRDHLTALTGRERPAVVVPAARAEPGTGGATDAPYVPGVAPSW